jgi:hypothetical protein
MSGRNWLEQVEDELLRRKLPRPEVARLTAELADHFDDVMEARCAPDTMFERQTARFTDPLCSLTEERMSMEASVAESLGSPAAIADTAVREFQRRRHLLSRSRLAAFCTFVLLPLPAVVLAWAATFTGLVALGYFLNWLDVPDPTELRDVTAVEVLVTHLILVVVLIAPPAGIAALFGRLARKSGHVWGWGLAACLLVALGTAHGNIQATYSELPGKSELLFGLGFGINLLQMTKLGQFAVPLATGVLVLRRSALRAGCSTTA